MALVTTLGTGVSKHELVQVLQDLDEDPEDSVRVLYLMILYL